MHMLDLTSLKLRQFTNMPAKRTSEDQEQPFFELVNEVCKTSASLATSSWQRCIMKMAVACQAFLDNNAATHLSDAGAVPILASYSSDGTRVKTHFRKNLTLGPGMHKRQAHGEPAYDYLVHRGYFRHIDGLGKPHTSCLLRTPYL